MPKLLYALMGVMTLVMLVTLGVVAAFALGYITPPGIDQEPSVEPLGEPQYLKLEPPLTVNFERGQRISYLQAEVEIMSRQEVALEGVQHHMPVIRNNLLLLFADQSFQDLNTREGRERLRRESLLEINDILAEKQVNAEVEAIYFTSFIMQ